MFIVGDGIRRARNMVPPRAKMRSSDSSRTRRGRLRIPGEHNRLNIGHALFSHVAHLEFPKKISKKGWKVSMVSPGRLQFLRALVARNKMTQPQQAQKAIIRRPCCALIRRCKKYRPYHCGGEMRKFWISSVAY